MSLRLQSSNLSNLELSNSNESYENKNATSEIFSTHCGKDGGGAVVFSMARRTASEAIQLFSYVLRVDTLDYGIAVALPLFIIEIFFKT